MNVLLTDHMVCPRCGPPFRLVLVAREVADRRVRHGEFGCANCRDSFPVDDGFADMRPQPRSPAPVFGTPSVAPRVGDGPDAALRLAAALRVAEGPGIVVVWDGRENDVVGLAEIVPSLEIVATGWGAREFARRGVSAMAVGPVLPFGARAVRGAVIADAEDSERWSESVRMLAPGGRIVAARPSPKTAGLVAAAGCVVLAADDDMLVAAPKP